MSINMLRQKIKALIDAMDPKRKKIAEVIWETMNGHLNGIATGLIVNQGLGGFPEYENLPEILYTALFLAILAGVINGISFGAKELESDLEDQNHIVLSTSVKKCLEKLRLPRAYSDAINNGTSTWLYSSIALGNLYTLLCEQLGGYIDITSNTTELLTDSASGVLQCYAKNAWPYIGAFIIAAPFGILEFCRTLGTNTLEDLGNDNTRTRLQRYVKNHESLVKGSAWALESLLNSTTFAMMGAPIAWNYDTRWYQFAILLAAIGLGIGSVGIKKYDNKKYEDPANQVITFLGAVASVITFDLIVRGLGEDSQFPMIAWISMLASMLATVVAMGVYSGCVIKRAPEQQGNIQGLKIDFKPLGSYNTESTDEENPVKVDDSKSAEISKQFSDFGISVKRALEIISIHYDEVCKSLSVQEIKSVHLALIGEGTIDSNVIAVLTELQKTHPEEFPNVNNGSQEMLTFTRINKQNPGTNRNGTFSRTHNHGVDEKTALLNPSPRRFCTIS